MRAYLFRHARVRQMQSWFKAKTMPDLFLTNLSGLFNDSHVISGHVTIKPLEVLTG